MDADKWQKYLKIFTGSFSDRAIPCLPYLPWFKDCNRILDIGCGTGRVVEYLRKEMLIDAMGITINSLEVKEGISVLADMHEIPFEDESFDGVIAWDVLEHAVAPYIMLSEAHRVLTMKGRFLCFLPGEDWIDCNYHSIVLTDKQFRHLCKIAGFKSIEMLQDEGRSATRGGRIYKVIKC